jgi:AbrB family looped-hinge helix DNA binding protein
MCPKAKPCLEDRFGTTVMGERGQVVIPKDIRDAMGLQAGDRLVTLYHDGKLFLMTADEMKQFMDVMSERFASVANMLNTEKND